MATASRTPARTMFRTAAAPGTRRPGARPRRGTAGGPRQLRRPVRRRDRGFIRPPRRRPRRRLARIIFCAVRLLDALRDRQLLADAFPGESWRPWSAFLAALDGLPLDAEQLDLYRRCTG